MKNINKGGEKVVKGKKIDEKKIAGKILSVRIKSETRLIKELVKHPKPLLTTDEFAVIKEYAEFRRKMDWELAIRFLAGKLKKSPMRVAGIVNSIILKILRDFIEKTEEELELEEIRRSAQLCPPI